jgi:hypothetical protein
VHDDLFAQAETLARLDPRKPKQVNLRRAISSAYYAIFHYLIEESCCVQFGVSHVQAPFRNVIARAYTHGVMKAACTGFAGGTLKDAVIKGLPRDATGYYVIHQAIRGVGETLAEMQVRRNLADYDRSERFKRSDVLMLIESCKDAVAKFAALPMSDDKRFFLACLWAWKDLANR